MRKHLLWLTLIICAFTMPLTRQAVADSTSANGDGKVHVKASESTTPMDPENPLVPVDPGESPSTNGSLRIDFVSTINFASADIDDPDRTYNSLAQLFHDDTPARASYIQITDLREETAGWSLSLKQRSQFKNSQQVELTGAVLSFDGGWANSGGTGEAPTMFRDTISLTSLDTAYSVASAGAEAGNGTWMISFGASENNEFNQKNTLAPLKDQAGKEVLDERYQKPAYTNTAVSLYVPKKTNIIPGEYSTELLWLLEATP